MIISAPRLFLDGGFSGPGGVRIENDRIVEVLAGAVASDVALKDGFLAPGLIDLHNNGAFGVDCATATPADWEFFIDGLAARGVTSVLPTVITAPVAEMVDAAKRVAGAMARHPGILGVHLEGPFLSPEKPGAHRPDWLAVPDAGAVAALVAAPGVRVVTLAPEIPGGLAVIRQFVAAGVTVALGHTNAKADDMLAGVAAGARVVTHVFTAQSGLHQRAPGAVGVALTDEALHPCIIVDGVHVEPMVLKLAFAACPRLIAVTDSICIAGLPEGAERNFGGMPARVVGGVGRRPDGTIAGAVITLDEGVRRLIAAGIAPAVAFAAATCRPADALGLSDRGRIVPGARADLVWWGDDFSVRQVWVAGAPHGVLPYRLRGTESVREDLDDLETRPMPAIIGAFLAREAAGQAALRRAAGAIAALAEAVAARLQAGGRLFYVGAGTSGRLALLDAVECGPTFGVADGLIVPILAGGDGAFLRAVEGAEDDGAAAEAALAAHGVCAADAVVGIAASGATPFTLAGLRYAAGVGALTGAIVNNAGSPMAAAAEIAVEVLTGPEVIAGSTRLSAGTAQKIVLNALSSCVMIRLGKTYGPYMVDVRASNAKLRARAVRMVAGICGLTAVEAEAALVAADWRVKTAVVMTRLDVGPDEAREKLAAVGGRLREAVAADGRRGWSRQARP
jgi:N-acetylmuramic acid 6-phosphate etherase/N-acetylglucosamine-6-phosphate deacetylase